MQSTESQPTFWWNMLPLFSGATGSQKCVIIQKKETLEAKQFVATFRESG
jgi:hypothetical protein